MATHTHRTVTTTRHEWEVPANPAGNSQIGDFCRAFDAAATQYRREHGIHADDPLSDDALQVTGQEDGAVVISYEARTALAASR
ncbi:hypothetical protein Q8791_23125 [Nocardiopsis sp. CT-R113]|uniref:Uncharacterized protein n=1 Tax=Nocardiopsis codii TaxID=3065942 RepID=A0ABU7KCZ8_9ACTN|nr:hypothetical protein [Nocardiopsis sp. CT-R113]MEE2040114.1 hypothetical protein [Nocardiopsis sp. CT-R113]